MDLLLKYLSYALNEAKLKVIKKDTHNEAVVFPSQNTLIVDSVKNNLSEDKTEIKTNFDKICSDPSQIFIQNYDYHINDFTF